MREVEVGITNKITEETRYYWFFVSEEGRLDEECEKKIYKLWEQENRNRYNNLFYEQPFENFDFFISAVREGDERMFNYS